MMASSLISSQGYAGGPECNKVSPELWSLSNGAAISVYGHVVGKVSGPTLRERGNAPVGREHLSGSGTHCWLLI